MYLFETIVSKVPELVKSLEKMGRPDIIVICGGVIPPQVPMKRICISESVGAAVLEGNATFCA